MKITNKLKLAVAGLAVVLSGVALSTPTFAAVTDYINGSAEQSATGATVASDGTTLTSTVNVIINIAIGIIGLLAVIMIIVGGFQYTTSAGDSGKVTKAKNSILYGVIGLVIALLAFAIVNFVLKNVFGI